MQAVESGVAKDIAATSGIQSVPFSVSAIQSLRKGIEALEVQGYTPSALIVHHTDWTAIELACTATTGALEYQSIPLESATRRLFGVQVVATPWVTAGAAFAIAEGAVALDMHREGVQFAWSENAGAETFARNEIVGRCEGRFASSIYQPLGVAQVALK
jgi:hypothetical protein